jgi:hypothetical protein
MKYCSRHDIRVLLVVSLLASGLVSERILSMTTTFEWKQLVLPGFDTIMGV